MNEPEMRELLRQVAEALYDVRKKALAVKLRREAMKSINETDEIPVEVETLTDPDDSHVSTWIDASVIDVHGTNRSARILFEGEATDEQVAAGLVSVAAAAALAHSSGAYWALQRLLADPGRTP